MIDPTIPICHSENAQILFGLYQDVALAHTFEASAIVHIDRWMLALRHAQ